MRNKILAAVLAVGLGLTVPAAPSGADAPPCSGCTMEAKTHGDSHVPEDFTLFMGLEFYAFSTGKGVKAAVRHYLTFQSYGPHPTTNEDFEIEGTGTLGHNLGTEATGVGTLRRRGLTAEYTLRDAVTGDVIAIAYLDMLSQNFTGIENILYGDVHVYH